MRVVFIYLASRLQTLRWVTKKEIVPETLNELGVNWTRATLFKTVVSDLSNLENISGKTVGEIRTC